MQRQKNLPLDGEQSLNALWERFPKESRREATRLYARLMAAAVRSGKPQEENDEERSE
jgi:hypothetical protein